MDRTLSACLKLALLMMLAGTLAIPPAALAAKNDSLGTAVGTELAACPSDPGGLSGTCWGLNVSCPLVTQIQPYDATLKVTSPSGASIGTVIFITGGGGVGFYDTQFTDGSDLINAVVKADFTAVQIVFDNQVAGWLTGPALDGNGPLSLACLPATSMQWVHDHILTSGTPLCATGNSGGSFAIAYALSQYGLGSIFSMVEATSGPELSRIDQGCAPVHEFVACATCGSGTQSESYGLNNAENFVDPAYTGVVDGKPNGPCSKGINGSTQSAGLFHHDSILSDTAAPILSFPTTDIRFVFGGQDLTGGAIPEGLEWASVITSQITIVCVPSAGHMMANYMAGATQIENDLINYCKLQQPTH